MIFVYNQMYPLFTTLISKYYCNVYTEVQNTKKKKNFRHLHTYEKRKKLKNE